MTELKLSDISHKMRKLDICMMTTQAADKSLISRPMSNNGDVEYDGNSYFFTYEESEVVKDLITNSNINLTFSGADMLYISITGTGQLIYDKDVLKEHWLDELSKWFADGVDTPGITMIQVRADRIKFWHKEEEGEVKLQQE